MSDFSHAINLICKHEGFNEKAYADPSTGGEPYTIGYGTQFYPDGSPVKRGHLCSKEKALEYLFHEVDVIDTQLSKLNIGLSESVRQALISFIHSVGWESFFYSSIVDSLEREDLKEVTEEIGRWIFDADHQVIGSMLTRRREETNLLLTDSNVFIQPCAQLLLAAFRVYSGAPHEIQAIKHLEEGLNPYVLSRFANEFRVNEKPWDSFFLAEYDPDDFNTVFDR
jgi:lysozyme